MLQSKKSQLTGRQKAAIFLVSLGSEVSSEIFKHLREDEIEQLTFEIARLDRIEPEDRDRVLQEFQEMMMAQEFIQNGGIDYARDVLERALGTQKAIDIVNRLTSSLQVRPFDFIRRTDPSHLLNFIQGEHPQTIALILAYLDPQKSALILSGLPHQIQADVAKRIAHELILPMWTSSRPRIISFSRSRGASTAAMTPGSTFMPAALSMQRALLFTIRNPSSGE